MMQICNSISHSKQLTFNDCVLFIPWLPAQVASAQMGYWREAINACQKLRVFMQSNGNILPSLSVNRQWSTLQQNSTIKRPQHKWHIWHISGLNYTLAEQDRNLSHAKLLAHRYFWHYNSTMFLIRIVTQWQVISSWTLNCPLSNNIILSTSRQLVNSENIKIVRLQHLYHPSRTAGW